MFLKQSVVTVVLLLLAGSAYAFGRNISGVWTIPSGKHVVIVHDPGTGRASFTIPVNLPSMSASTLEFLGEVIGWKDLDDDSSANEFMFGGKLEPISYARGEATCTLEAELAGTGTVLGQAPNRKLRMLCKLTPRVKCDNGKSITVKELDCSGDWE